MSTSLLTVMSYINGGIFDLERIFNSLKVYKIKNPPLKKNKSIDIHAIEIPENSIISMQYGKLMKGIESLKKKPKGMYEIFLKDGSVEIDKYKNIYKYKHLYYKRPGNGKPFPHQITMIYSYKPGVNINMFIFRECIKIAGFKKQLYCEKMIMNIFTNYIVKCPGAIIHDIDKPISFSFESAMTNKKFVTKHKYNLTKINTLFNKLKDIEGDNSLIIISTYETTSDTGVTIKLKSEKPQGYTYVNWEWQDEFIRSEKDCIPNQKIKDQKCTTVTIYDHKYLMSFRYSPLIQTTFDYIQEILDKYKDQINIKINKSIKKFKPTYI